MIFWMHKKKYAALVSMFSLLTLYAGGFSFALSLFPHTRIVCHFNVPPSFTSGLATPAIPTAQNI